MSTRRWTFTSGDSPSSVLRACHPSLQVDCVVRRGAPWDKLANVACELGAEMIVVGAGGERSVAGTRFLGRVVMRVATTSNYALLVIAASDLGTEPGE